MKRILVTGATGFLGRHVIDILLGRDAPSPYPDIQIRILSRSAHPWADEPRIESIRADIMDREAVRNAVSDCGVVVHLAGIVQRGRDAAGTMHEVHVGGTRNICEAALANDTPRVVVASSSGTIAVSRKPVVHTESAPYAEEVVAHWPYYVSKIAQEKLAFSFAKPGNLEVVVLNPSILLGPGDVYRSSTDDVRAFLERKIPNIPSGGLNFVDARDAAQAFVRAIEKGRNGQRYLVGGPNMTIREFFGRIEAVSGVRKPALSLPEWLARGSAALARRVLPVFGSSFPIDDASIEMAYRFWYCNCSLAEKELGFQSRPADITLADTVRFIRAGHAPIARGV